MTVKTTESTKGRSLDESTTEMNRALSWLAYVEASEITESEARKLAQIAASLAALTERITNRIGL